MLRALRDKAAAGALTAALRLKLRHWCDMLKVEIDSDAKRLVLEGRPKGEVQPLRVELEGYRLEKTGDTVVLSWESLRVSREWLHELARTLLPNNRLELPEGTPVELLRTLF